MRRNSAFLSSSFRLLFVLAELITSYNFTSPIAKEEEFPYLF